MRIPASAMLAAFVFALPAVAQTEGQEQKPKQDVEKLWRIEVSGISGWAAASTAARVSSILNKDKKIKNLVFDTTGVGYFDAGKDVPEIADLNELLDKKRAGSGVRVRKLEEVELPKAEEIYELQISGLGWMGTAIETRDVLSKLDGVIRVHPNGLNGKALVYVKDKKAFTEDKAEAALQTTEKLRLRKFGKAWERRARWPGDPPASADRRPGCAWSAALER